jgi:hypothetical protein
MYFLNSISMTFLLQDSEKNVESDSSAIVLASMVGAMTLSYRRPLNLTICKSETAQPTDIKFFTINYCEISKFAKNDRNRLCGGAPTHM